MPNSQSNSVLSFHRVLLATDFSPASQAAFRAALETCVALHASLLILHVFEYASIVPPEVGGQLLEMQVFYESCRDSLEILRLRATQAGVACETALESGIPASTILDAIAEKQIDLAILGTNALHGFERLVFGSTAETVLREALCPVLTVGPQVPDPAGAPATGGPVVFATDFHRVTIQALRYAASFCHLTGSPLHCLHVLPRTLEGGVQRDVLPGIVSEALKQLGGACGLAIGPPICATAYGSEVSQTVVDYAKQQNARMIVLGVRQASLLASHVPEHIAYRIITEAPCPVLTMAFASAAHATLASHASVGRPASAAM